MAIPLHCSERSLTNTIDSIAFSSPDRVWARYPITPEAFERGEFRSVTFASLARAINRLSWHLEIALSKRQPGDVVAYIGPSDLRYFVLACAASKCQLKALFSSPRNNLESHLSLLEKTGCQYLLQPRERSQDPTVGSILNGRQMETIEMPTLDDLLDETAVDHYNVDATWSALAQTAFLTLHTSGSTGLPKPIDITHGLISTIDAQQMLPDVDGLSVTAREWAHRSVYTALPPFHSAGINFFSYSVFQATELVFGPSDKPPSVSTVEQMLDSKVASAAVMAPSLLAEVAAEEGLLEKISQWSSVTFGGGPLPQDAGDALWPYTKVLQILGSTETFNLPELAPRSIDEWPYHSYHPSLGINFEPRDQGLCELVFRRDQAKLKHQGAFWAFPELEEYPMKDLYEQHPSKAGLWTNRGRLDDIVVLSNGEKLNPSGAERLIAQDPKIKSALIVGNARIQPALLVEPAETMSSSPAQATLAEIMPIIQRANETLPGHAQIHASHVQVLDSPGPFLRSSKGEVQRAATTAALSDIVTELYNSAETGGGSSMTIDFTDQKTLCRSIITVVAADDPNGCELDSKQSFFDSNFDSLRVMKLLRTIKTSMKEQLHDTVQASLTPRVIYQNHTATTLAGKLMEAIGRGASDAGEAGDSKDDMAALLEKYTARIENIYDADTAGHVVLLTGSTGSLGSYILDSLISNKHVTRIMCLNRAGSDVQKQTKIHRSRGLSEDFPNVQFFNVDLSQVQLGLDDQQYNILANASHIIHNAWPVNFNLPLSSFDPQLAGCHHLVELANASPKRPEITFISSVGAANNWTQLSDAPVPEICIQDFDAAEPMGYAQSKLIAELQLTHASKQLAIPVTICRVGQVAGPVTRAKGMWSLDEWFPSLLSSCSALGVVPAELGCMDCMDWIAVDLLSEMLVEIVVQEKPTSSSSQTGEGMVRKGSTSQPRVDSAIQSRATSRADSPVASESGTSASNARFLHFVNPHKAQWRDVATQVARLVGEDSRVVPYTEWLEALIAASESSGDAMNIPAAKLIEFYREVGTDGARRPVFACEAAQRNSLKLRELPPVSFDWLKHWISQWASAEKVA